MSVSKKLSEIDILDIGNTIQLAGAVYMDGSSRLLLVPFPDEVSDVEKVFNKTTLDVEILAMDSADWEKFLRQTDLLETEVLQKASDGKLAKVILRKSQRQIDQGVSWQVWKRDGYACRYCGKDDVPLTVDHIITWETGGPTVEQNLLSACRKDNKARGNLSYEDWLKHPHYLKVSKALRPEVQEANEAVLGRLNAIPRNKNVRSR